MKRYLILTIFLFTSGYLFSQYSIDKNKIIESAMYLEFRVNNNLHFGTGFIIRDSTETGDFLYLITAKHVLGEYSKPGVFKLKDSTLYITYTGNIYSEVANEVSINVQNMLNNNLIRFSADRDIAVIFMGKIIDKRIRYPLAANLKELKVSKDNPWIMIGSNFITNLEQTRLGTDAFIFGYPKTIGLQKNPQYDYDKPLLRRGVIAGIYKEKKTIIVDCPSYGGNSGGPVYEIDTNDNRIKLVGVVSQWIPIVSEYGVNNSDYLVAVSAEIINEVINTFK
ncbi:serine protease [uncultured Draconibacterium sp.]|uniref:S1 family peptidase n=1 Tax=uncultured Draconibacterium sp. TaxID=1573823 RepID=UPI002AA80750|nr:serine protease [uncultured Draconibacterium sp.]